MTLSLTDLANSSLYLDSIIEKQIILDGKSIDIIEGVTTSFNMHKINFSYDIINNKVSMSYFDGKNKKEVSLVETRVNSVDDFEKALIKADNKLYTYFAKN